MTRQRIERVAIFPSIGIARVGNSPDAFFFGPEVPGERPGDGAGYRDAQGCIKRQAARFRLYGLDAAGAVVREITAEDGPITWTVQIANEKAGWFNFDVALDIPAARGEIPGVAATTSVRRNLAIQGDARAQLSIRPRARSIGGRCVNADGASTAHAFDDGCFFGQPVYLGELRTDEAGRLIFLGGRGASASHGDVPPSGFANNDGWHDDTSDGPVQARVVIDGQELSADAWVATAPPDFAPGVQALVTGWDLVREVGFALDPATRPPQPRFSTDIFPLLARFADAQWVNAGFARTFGWGAANDFRDPGLLQRLNDPSTASQPMRRAVFNRFRTPDYKILQSDAWPGVYGDGATMDAASTDPRNWMAILPGQHAMLAQWAVGDFIGDGPPPAPLPWDRLTPAEQVQGLDRAVLDETTGGPFHPGCECTWPMRVPSLYAAPGRLRRRNGAEPDYGSTLTSISAMAPGGPLDGCAPGSVTRWMACPWQTDTASCLSAYRPWAGEYLPTFWPARVPNDVLTADQYATLMDPARPTSERLQAFDPAQRQKWLRGIVYQPDTDPPAVITTPNPRAVFITEWPHIGMVTQRPGPNDEPALPGRLWVETGRTLPGVAPDNAATAPLWTQDPSRER